MSREIDSLIAEHVFGYHHPVALAFNDRYCFECSDLFYMGNHIGNAPNYSTQIQDAWLVVERMWEKGFGFNIATMSEADYSKNTGWDAWFIKLETKEHFGSWLDGTSSAPMAICLASLKALGVENET